MSTDRDFDLVAQHREDTVQSTLGGCDWPGCLLHLGCMSYFVLRAEERSFDLEAEARSFALEAE